MISDTVRGRHALRWYRDGVDVEAHLPLLSTYMGHVEPGSTFWYLSAAPELLVLAAQRLEDQGGAVMTALAPTLRGVLHRTADQPAPGQPPHHRRLPGRLAAAARALRNSTGKQPSQLDFGDLDAPLIGAFLDHLETRAAQQRPQPQRPPGRYPLIVPLRRAAPPRARRPHRPSARHPAKRCDRADRLVPTDAESRRPARRPDRDRWSGRRDHALLAVALQTGLRVSELTGLRLPGRSRSGPGRTCSAAAKAESNAAPR